MYLCKSKHSLCIITDQTQANAELVESEVLQHFYEELQNGLQIDELLPQLVSKKIITINDKILITESGKNINERCQFFLDHYVAKPLSAGDPAPLYKLLQVMDGSVKCILLATKIKQSLMTGSLQDKISGEYKISKRVDNNRSSIVICTCALSMVSADCRYSY